MIFFVLIFEKCSQRCWDIEIVLMFCHIGYSPFSLVTGTTTSYFFHNAYYFFSSTICNFSDETDCTFYNLEFSKIRVTVCLVPANGAFVDTIFMSHLSRLKYWALHVALFQMVQKMKL